jgi:hypothetical protein
MNIGILIAIVAFLAFRGSNGSSSAVADPKNGLAGYTGFAYFPLFAPAKPMEDDVPYFYDRSLPYSQLNQAWNAFIQTMQPGTYYLVRGIDLYNDSLIYVYERIGAFEVKKVAQYNPDLRMKVVDGVPETAEASE